MKDDFIRLIRRLDELIERMDRHVNSDTERLTWLHWSDLELLKDARRRIVEDNRSLTVIQRALLSSIASSFDSMKG